MVATKAMRDVIGGIEVYSQDAEFDLDDIDGAELVAGIASNFLVVENTMN
jgi:hypothetical protein